MVLKRDKRTSREILTTEGYIRFKRYRLYAVNADDHKDSVERCKQIYGGTSFFPLDMFLGIDNAPFKMTVDMALRVAKIGASSPSYEAASKRLMEDFEIKLSDDTIRKVVDYVSQKVLEDDVSRTEEAIKDYDYKKARAARRGRRPKDGFILYVQADGAMFNTRTSKAAADDADKKREPSSWKENKLGVVFRSDDLIELKEHDETGKPMYRIGKRGYICSTRGVEVFRERLLWLMLENGLQDASAVVMISDGAPWLRKMRELLFPYATQILDLFHLKENVMAFGQHIFNNKKAEYYPWWKEVCEQLENGQWNEVLNRSEIAVYRDDKATPPGVVNIYNYIWNNRDFIDYPTYKEKGYFVGSGAIESGNKTVMQERLKLSGMKWIVDNAEALLALRSKIKSETWEDKVVPLIRKQYTMRRGDFA